MSETPSQQSKAMKIRGGELVPGTVLDERLEIVRRLSRGVKESVYLCRQLVPPYQTVVLKVLPRGRSGEDTQTTYARFQREIVALYSISHPNVVNVFEAINDGEVFGYTMEYVEGGNLHALLEEGGELPFERILEILTQAADALAAIHDAGIIHRSLKPKNILLDMQGTVKITDFAVAKVEGQRNLTSHGTVIGTMEYVSPEYVTKGALDKRLDIYSLGVIGYEMITGTTPFQSDDFIETLSKRASMDPEPPHLLNPACPSSLSRIVMRALERNPDDRYQSAAEMLNELMAIDLSEDEPAANVGIGPRGASFENPGAGFDAPVPPTFEERGSVYANKGAQRWDESREPVEAPEERRFNAPPVQDAWAEPQVEQPFGYQDRFDPFAAEPTPRFEQERQLYDDPAEESYESEETFPFQEPKFHGAHFGEPSFDEPQFDDARFGEPRFDEPRYDEPRYDEPGFAEPRYDDPRYDDDYGQQGYGAHDELRDDPMYDSGSGWEDEYTEVRQSPFKLFLSWLFYAGIAGVFGFGMGYLALLAWWKFN